MSFELVTALVSYNISYDMLAAECSCSYRNHDDTAVIQRKYPTYYVTDDPLNMLVIPNPRHYIEMFSQFYRISF